jgi:hypothetical protein
MMPFRSTAALVVFVAGCSSASPPSYKQTVQHVPADTGTCIARANRGAACPDSTSKPPVLSVGVSDPDTQLILPWFLTDIINAVNTHESAGDLLHTIRNGF